MQELMRICEEDIPQPKMVHITRPETSSDSEDWPSSSEEEPRGIASQISSNHIKRHDVIDDY